MNIPKLLAAAITAICIGMFLGATTGLSAPDTQSPAQRGMLIEGAQLWSIYCNQCHNARPGSQFSPAQWDAITMHMKTQSIMPAKDMRAITEFLKRTR